MPGTKRRRAIAGDLDPNPQTLSVSRTWTSADFLTDNAAGNVRSVEVDLPIGTPLLDRLGIEIYRGTVYKSIHARPDLTAVAIHHTIVVEVAFGYRNLDGDTEIDPDDTSVIMYWKWQFDWHSLAAGAGVDTTQDNFTNKVQTGDGRGIVAVTNRMYMNMRWSELPANGWAGAAADVELKVRLLYRFVRISAAEVSSLLANAVALQ